MKHPLSISVIIPVYNRCQFLHEALDSVARQQYQPLEILIVDDGSTDDVEKCVLEYSESIRYVRRARHLGAAAARNAGIQHARGDSIAFLDNDDVWTPTHLSQLAGCLEADPAIQIAQGRLRNFRDSGDGARFWCSPPYYLASLPSAIYRRQVFETVGPLDESLKFGEDCDFFMRCWERNIEKAKVDHLSLLYRRHPHNMTARKNLRELGLVQVYRKRRDRIEQGLYMPRSTPFGLMRDYLGESPAAYDDGRREPVDEALFGHLHGREQGTGNLGNHTGLQRMQIPS